MRNLLAGLLLLGMCQATAQDSTCNASGFPQEQSHTRKLVASGIMTGIIGSTAIWAADAWWQGRAHRFNFYSEGWFSDYSLGMDKVGLAYASYFYFRTFRNIMLWGGFEPATAFWWGAGITEFLVLGLEIGDGYSTFGFSYEDFLSNTLGLSYGLLQTEIPWLENFAFKWSYFPVGVRNGLNFTQHYDSHTYWLSFNMHNLLPGTWGESWPKFLQLALGYSVERNQTRREAVIGLDFNIEVIPAPNPDIQLVQKSLNLFHLPSPAVKFSEHGNPSYYLLHLN